MSSLQFGLMIVGICTISGVIICIGSILFGAVMDIISNLKWQHKYKHRFDKPPTAKCYCKDCKYYIVDAAFNRCCRGHIEHWAIAENDFCWLAEPLKEDPELMQERSDDMLSKTKLEEK